MKKVLFFVQLLCVIVVYIRVDGVAGGEEICESIIETRAVLLSCPEKDTGCDDDDPLTKAIRADEYRIFGNKGAEMKKAAFKDFPNRVTQCKRKLVITMKLNNKGKIDCDDGFIVIDHVYDPLTHGRARLLSPVVIKLRQEQMIELYPLQFQKVVNSNPHESIFTKEVCSKYKGCSMDLDNPTCGITTYNGEPVPFSEGFCCSCNPKVNAMREVPADKHENAHLYRDPSLFAHEKNRFTRNNDKKRVVVNPELLKLRAAGKQSGVRQAPLFDEDENESNSLDDSGQKPPVYFFEHDRQVVCAPENLLRELCNMEGRGGGIQLGGGNTTPKEGEGEESQNEKNEQDDGRSNSDDGQSNGSKENGTCCDCGKAQQDNGGERGKDRASNKKKNPVGEGGGSGGGGGGDGGEKGESAAGTNPPDGMESPFVGRHKLIRKAARGQGASEDYAPNASELKAMGMSRGRRESGRGWIRRKRYTRYNDEYNYSYEYAPNPRRNRNKRILEQDQGRDDSTNDLNGKDEDVCMEVLVPPTVTNCTPPVFFFTHDKNIVCPQDNQGKQNTSCQEDNSDNSDYDDLNVDVGDNQGDSQDKTSLAPDMSESPAAQEPKLTRIHTPGGTWDINTNVKQGNMFRLDLIKNGREEGTHGEKIEEIKFEEKKYFPNEERGEKLKEDYRQGGPKFRRPENQRFQAGEESRASGGEAFKHKKLKDPSFAQNKKNEIFEDLYRELGSLQGQKGEAGGADGARGAQKDGEANRKDAETLQNPMYGPSDVRHADTERFQNARLEELLKADSKDADAKPASKEQERSNPFRDRPQVRKGSKGEKGYKNYETPASAAAAAAARDYWKQAYYQSPNYPSFWDGKSGSGDFRYFPNFKDNSRGREDIVDLLAYNYPRTDAEENKYLVSSQKVFFADSKSNRRAKDVSNFGDASQGDRFYGDAKGFDRGDPRRSHSRTSRRGAPEAAHRAAKKFAGNHHKAEVAAAAKVAEHKNYGKFTYDGMRNRRRATHSLEPDDGFVDFDPQHYNDLHKLRNAQFVRNRERRSAEYNKPEANRWKHKSSTGASYQYDSKDDLRVYSPADDGKRCAKLKCRSVARDKEREKIKREIKLSIDKKRLDQSYKTSPSKFTRGKRGDGRCKRHILSEHRQKRGGQECTESQKQDTDKSNESTHCMQHSDLWYSVYVIKRPQISQLVGVQVYDKQVSCDGTSSWRDLTKGYMIRLGTFLSKAEDQVPTISMTFTQTEGAPPNIKPQLDIERYRLLIPTHLTDEGKINMYPEFTGGPSEFLLVSKDQISANGDDCDMIGTSFEGFVRQPDRCSEPPGSCLKRQPVDLWREDLDARIRGKRGKYFIENFASVSNTNIKSYSNLTGEHLALDYFDSYSSVLEIEMRADGNAIVRQGENAQIPSVYIDSVAPKKTKIVLAVLNMGLTSGLFRPRLGECPSNLDPTWCPLEGPLVLIPPQQRHDFKLELSGVLPAKRVRCAVEVLNHKNEKVAYRKIVIKKSDRCICAFFCKCHCLAGSKKSTCVHMSKDEYNAAGYFDPLPQRNAVMGGSSDNLLKNAKIVLIVMLYALLVLGLLKAIFGLFWRRIGVYGVPVIVGPRKLCQYYERDICCYEVVYDECAFPVHPQDCRTVQVVPKIIEFFINILFFFLYFLKIIWLLLASIPCCRSFCADCEGCCKADEGEYCYKET